MAKKLKFGNVILCDHVVPGEQNKTTLVNVYSGDIIMTEMPAGIMLGLYCEHYPDTTELVEITLAVKLGKTLVARITGQVQALAIGEVGQITIPLFPIKIVEDTFISIIASAKDYKDSEILRKKVYFVREGQTSISSPLPSARSRPDAPVS